MIKCYFDGCCEPQNPYGNMGFGAYIQKDNQTIFTASEFLPASKSNSNNVAEYLALEQILLWFKQNEVKENTIHVHGDSKLVINQMMGSWRIKHGLYKEHALRCKKLIQELGKDFVFIWIPRDYNQKADDLSKGKMIENNVEFKIQPHVNENH